MCNAVDAHDPFFAISFSGTLMVLPSLQGYVLVAKNAVASL
jgi:hypothetical protein